MPDSSVLITGGCGFVGYHVVKALLEQENPKWSSIHVISRNPNRNRLPQAQYHACDISSSKDLQLILDEIRPIAIIHCAAPSLTKVDISDCEYFEANFRGTKQLLECAVATNSVKAFVYTSVTSVAEGSSFSAADENVRLKTETSLGFDTYGKSKSLTDRLVRDFNGIAGIRTTCLRLATTYGERDSSTIPSWLWSLQEGNQKMQIGSNTGLCDFVSVTNAAHAHVLALKALLHSASSSGAPIPANRKVDGEAFIITDGKPLPFWTFGRKIWAQAGYETPANRVWKIPAVLALYLAIFVEWWYFLFFWGFLRPRSLRRHLIEMTYSDYYFSIEKARSRLGYEPADDRDEQIKQGVDWALHGAVGDGESRKEI